MPEVNRHHLHHTLTLIERAARNARESIAVHDAMAARAQEPQLILNGTPRIADAGGQPTPQQMQSMMAARALEQCNVGIQEVIGHSEGLKQIVGAAKASGEEAEETA